MTLTPEQRAEHLAFLQKIVDMHLADVRTLVEWRAAAAMEDVLRKVEWAIRDREEFRLWGQADPPFTQEDVALLRQRAEGLDAAAATYNYPDAQQHREGRSAEYFANEATQWRDLADRIEGMLQPESE